MKKTKYAFVDRDGTINVNVSHTHKIEDLEFMPGALEGLAKLQKIGWRLIVITNQAGIAKGVYTFEQMHAFNKELAACAKTAGVVFTGFYHCPHHPDFTGPCACRKPAPGMLRHAARDHGIDLTQSMVIGDHETDILAGKAVGAKTFLITDDLNLETQADYKVKSILEICDIVW